MWVQHGGPPGYHPWWGVFGGVLLLLMFAVLVGLLIWAVLRLSREGSLRAGGSQPAGPVPTRAPDAALEHARYRYARGEIDRDAFLRISQDLGAPVSAMPPPPAAAAAEGPEG
jgi:uncharacterized membrane protein